MESITGEYVRIGFKTYQQKSQYFIRKRLHISLDCCLERVNAMFYGIKSCWEKRKKDTRIILYSLKVSERFAFTVCCTEVRFCFSHKGSVSK